MKIASIAREPLVHFLLIGAVLFGAYAMVAEPEPSDDVDRIVVAAGEVERLASFWEKRRLRAPSPEELADLIDEHVREEVLYREALALGLDRDDAVIRRLLRQKYEFLTQDLAVAGSPDPAELRAWYEANSERYRSTPRLSFAQVHIDADRRGAAAEEYAAVILASLRSGASAEHAGDSRMLDASYSDLEAPDISALFGQGFADSLLALEPGAWSGPVRSGYGLHLVRVGARTNGVLPPYEAVEERVRSDWEHEQRQLANEAVFQRLLDRYEVVVEGSAAPGSAARSQP